MNYDAACVKLVGRATKIEGTIAIYRAAGSLVLFPRDQNAREETRGSFRMTNEFGIERCANA